MMTLRLSRPLLAVVVASALSLALGGLAVASNMGFKLNKPIVFKPAIASGQIGSNWTSLPFNNPYGTCAGLCTQLGLTAAKASLQVLDQNTGNFSSAVCATPACTALTLIPGKQVNILQPAGGPTSVIIVGSHNPTLSLTIPTPGAGNIGNLWYSLPYHTTAVTGQDLCNQIGMTSTGTQRGGVTRVNAVTGQFVTGFCGSTASNLN